MLPVLLGAGTALNVMGQMSAADAQERAANKRAAALQLAAEKRLTKGKQEADLALAQGGANQTSAFSSMLSRGVSRNASVVGQSLEEISNRAKFAADQAISDAQAEAQAMLEDAGAITDQGRQARTAAAYGVAGTILGSGASYLQGRYGKAAYENFF